MDDGTEIPSAFAEQIVAIITEVEKFWGSTAEFRTLSK
jgi:hypothetical protein